MKIIEIQNKEITIKGAPNPNDNSLGAHESLPNHNHCSLFVGGAGSGKSSLIINLMTSKKFNSYRKKFDKIFFFTGSKNTLPDSFLSKLAPERVFDDMEDLPEIMQDIKPLESEKILMVFDDLTKELKEYEPILKQLIFNRRHYAGGCSIWIVSQKLRSIPLTLRTGADSIFFFSNSLKHKKELEALFDEFITDMNKENFYEMVNQLFKTSKPYEFLYINKRDSKYYKNFNQLIIEE